MKITRTSQPQSAVGVDWANPNTKNLHFACDRFGRNYAGRIASLGTSGTLTDKVTTQGVGRGGAGTGYFTSSPERCLVAPTNTEFTVVGTFALSSTGQTNKYLAYDVISGAQAAVILGFVANTVEFYCSIFTGSSPRTGSGMVVNDTLPHTFGYSYDGSNWIGYLDGVKVFSTTRTFSCNLTVAGATGSLLSASGSNTADASILQWMTFDKGIGEARLKSLTSNPWQIFQPTNRPIFVGVGAAGNPTITSDSTASYLIREAVASDISATYGIATTTAVSSDSSANYLIRGLVTSDASASYLLRTNASSDSTASYLIRVAVTADISAAYGIVTTTAVSSDTSAAYAICEAVALDTTSSYLLRTSASSDTSASYAIAAPVTSDTSASYSILTAGAVTSDTASSYSIRGVVQSDASIAYELRGAVQSTLSGGYAIRQAVVQDASAAYLMRGAVESDLAAAYAVLSLTAISADLAASYTVTGVPGVSGLSEADIAAIWAYSSRTLTSTTPTAADIAAQVRIELAAELAKIDAAISTRATPASVWAYTQ